MASRWRCAALVAVAVLGCDADNEGVLRPVHRFVDPPLRTDGREDPPTATIADDRRYVLQDYPGWLVLMRSGVPVPAGGSLPLRVPLPDSLAGASRLVLEPSYVDGKTWTRGTAISADVRRSGGRAFAEGEIDFAERAGSTVSFQVGAREPPDPTLTYETRAVEVPEGAILEFATGVLEAGWEQGPVELSLAACESGRCVELFSETLDPGRPEVRGWREHRVRLDHLAGRRLSLRFASQHRASRPGAFSFPVWANPTLYAPAERDEDELNLLLISIDTLRADHLPSYGYARDTAPFIEERLAQRGAVFETCISSANTTAPSHMTLFTSLLPSVHGVRAISLSDALPRSAVTLAQAFRSHGLTTAAFTENGALAIERGFGRGFDFYYENKDALLRSESHVMGTFRRASRWIQRRRDRRWFAFVHTYQVHTPYHAPARYADLFREPVAGRPHEADLPLTASPSRYDREIRFVDDALGALFRALERDDLLRDTLVILTSDHGEAFGEHGFVYHAGILHDEVLHVPLFLVGPGIPAGRRIRAPVGLVDLAPTALELLRLPGLPSAMGASFAALAQGEPADASWWERPLVSESWSPLVVALRTGRVTELLRPMSPEFAVRRGSQKLIRRPTDAGDRFALYDLARDPREQRDRQAEDRGAQNELAALLADYERSAQGLHAALLGGRSSEAPPLDPQREDKLRALGYLE